MKKRLMWSIGLLCVGASICLADPGPWRKDAGPWYALSWSKVPEDCTHITPFIWVKKQRQNNKGRIWQQATDPAQAARASLAQPEGRRSLFIWDLHRAPDLLNHPQDVCFTRDGQPAEHTGIWPENGIEATGKSVHEFFKAFKDAGGKLDYLVLDFEVGYQNWGKKKEWFEAVQNDPRSAELKRRLRFDDFPSVMNLANKRYLAWNNQAGRIKDETTDKAIFGPVRELFPEAVCSNYNSYVLTEKEMVPELNGHLQYHTTHAGQAMTMSFYGAFGQLARTKLDGENPYALTPMNVVRWHINRARGVRRSEAAPFHPWLSHRAYAKSQLKDNGGYAEMVLHLLLHADETVLYWNPDSKRNPESARDDAQDRLLNGLIGEVNGLVAPGTRRAAELKQIPWDCPILVSGVEADTRTLWRVSCFEGDLKQLKAVQGKMVGQAFVLEHGGWRLVLPGAEVIDVDGALSSLGVWASTPAGKRPMLTKR